MIKDLWLIGIGTGSPAHVTLEGMQALREAAIILLPLKGDDKQDLAALRYAILEAAGSDAEIRTFTYPERDPALPYGARVSAWHDEIARRWIAALGPETPPGPVALMVWGDPALYDSTLRIARRLTPCPRLRVVPGITAVQALTAAHAIPLNTVDGPIRVTTGRQLRSHGLEQNHTEWLMIRGQGKGIKGSEVAPCLNYIARKQDAVADVEFGGECFECLPQFSVTQHDQQRTSGKLG